MKMTLRNRPQRVSMQLAAGELIQWNGLRESNRANRHRSRGKPQSLPSSETRTSSPDTVVTRDEEAETTPDRSKN